MRLFPLLPALVAGLIAALPVASSAEPGPDIVPARGGVWVGVGVAPVYPYPYPYYYAPPPPVYYAPPPPPVYYAPAPPPVADAHACYAGPYMCPTGGPLVPGAPCSCATADGRWAPGRAGH